MIVTPALAISREFAAIRKDVLAIRAVDRRDMHAFVEDKDAVCRRLDDLATRFRNTFGGTPAKVETGLIADTRGRLVRVEHRRRRKAA